VGRRLNDLWRVLGSPSNTPAILIVGYLAVFMFGYAGGRAPLRHFDNELLNLPVRWDAGWYLAIVTGGYSGIGLAAVVNTAVRAGVRDYAVDPGQAARSWTVSAQLTGVDAFGAAT